MHINGPMNNIWSLDIPNYYTKGSVFPPSDDVELLQELDTETDIFLHDV